THGRVGTASDRPRTYREIRPAGRGKVALAFGVRHGPQAPGCHGPVSAHVGPHLQKRELHAHGAGSRGRTRRGDSQSQAMKLSPHLLIGILACAQQKPSPKEQEELENALAEAGADPADYLRAIEKHLENYPDSPRKAELERAATRAAMEANDDRRIIL